MNKEPVVQQTDFAVLLLRTTLNKRIGLLNTLIIFFGIVPFGILVYHYNHFMDLERTANLTFYILPISAVVVGTLYIYRKLSIDKIPVMYNKTEPCRIYRIIATDCGNGIACYIRYHNSLNPLLSAITDYTIIRQIDKDVFDNLLVQVVIHFPIKTILDIQLPKPRTFKVKITCQRVKKNELLELLRLQNIDAEPVKQMENIISHDISSLLDNLKGRDAFDRNAIERTLLVLTKESDFCYQRVLNEFGYRIQSIEVTKPT